MSDYDKSLHRHDKNRKMESRKAASEEVRLQTTAKNRQRGCRRDVQRQTVPNTCGSDRKSTIADGRQGRVATLMYSLGAEDTINYNKTKNSGLCGDDLYNSLGIF